MGLRRCTRYTLILIFFSHQIDSDDVLDLLGLLLGRLLDVRLLVSGPAGVKEVVQVRSRLGQLEK